MNELNTKNKRSFKLKIIYLIIFTMILFIGFSNANGNFIDDSTKHIFNLFTELKGGEPSGTTFLPTNAQNTYGMNITIAQYLAIAIIPLFLVTFLIKGLLAYAFNDKDKIGDGFQFVSLLIVLALITPKFGIYVAGKNGSPGYQKPIVVFVGEQIALKFFYFVDSIGEQDFDKPVDIPDFKLADSVAFYDDYYAITNLMLKADFDKEAEKITVVKEQGFYRVNVMIGGEIVSLSLQSNEVLNNQVSEIGIDLEAKEEAYAVAHFTDLFDHAAKVKKALEGVDVGQHKQTTASIFDTILSDVEVAYSRHYTTYCDSIYKDLPEAMDTITFNNFLDVAALCASKNFIAKNYQNPFYDYEQQVFSNTVLNKGYAMYFGTEIENYSYSVDQIINKAKSTCEGGYYACAQAANFAAHKDFVRNIKAGVVSPLARTIGDNFDASDKTFKLITTRGFDSSYAKTRSFKDLNLGKSSVGEFDFETTSTNYSENINAVISSLVSLTKVDIDTDFEKVLNTYVADDIAQPFKRLATCAIHSSQVKNGFRCTSITSEMLKAGSGFLQGGSKLVLLSEMTNFSHSKSKKDSLEVGKNSKFTKSMNTAKVLSAGSVMYLTDKPFLNTPYQFDGTVEALISSKIIMSLMISDPQLNSDLTNIISNIGWKMIWFGIALFVIVLAVPFILITRLLATVVKIITMIQISPISFLIAVINNYGSARGLIIDFFKQLSLLVIYSITMLMTFDFLDILIMSFVEDLMYNYSFNFVSIENFFLNIFQFLMYTIFSLFVIVKFLKQYSIEIEKSVNKL
ncbi:hypothetical protein AB4264_24100 [Vibrio sp. 10N.261.55.B8]|uniref:hypothetical protein n=1 Tax=unclassified Vibrio TaxID=2614977 RepID=UPI0035517F95